MGKGPFILRIPRRSSTIVNSAFAALLFGLFSYLMILHWRQALPKLNAVKPHEWAFAIPVLLIQGSMTALILYGCWTAASRFLQECFPRCIRIDCETRILSVQNIPLLKRFYRFEEIESLQILNCSIKGGWWAWLCMQIRGQRRLIRILEFKTSAQTISDDIENIARPIANPIADRVQVPIHESKTNPWRILFIAGY